MAAHAPWQRLAAAGYVTKATPITAAVMEARAAAAALHPRRNPLLEHLVSPDVNTVGE